MRSAVVEAIDLTKSYGSVVAVDRLNLRVHEGEIFGFLGPNGSGKTTTILMMLGLTEPTAGAVRVVGLDPVRRPLAVKRVVSYLPETVGFYDDMTATENLEFTAALNRIPKREAAIRISDALDTVRLTAVADRPAGAFSRGMKQRLGIAEALLKQPRLVFLDDPTIGLDPEGIEELLGLIVSMGHERGITVFLSSHLLEHVQRICDRVGILFQGTLQAVGSVAELLADAGRGDLRIEVKARGDLGPVVREVRAFDGVNEVRETPDGFTVECTEDPRPRISAAVVKSGGQLLEIRAVEQTLGDLYLHYFRESQTTVPEEVSA